MVKLIVYCFVLSIVIANTASAQNRKLSGTITDGKNNPVPFAAITLKHQLIGTNSNEYGSFDFYFPDSLNDSIVISSLGFTTQAISPDKISSPLNIRLKKNEIALPEVVIHAYTPEDYIRMAMRNVKRNYPAKPFQSQAYYREQLIENNILINQCEGIFKTYYPNYQDTVKNQHQLLLYRKADSKQITFMREEAERRKEKKIRKEKREGRDTTGTENTDAVRIAFGGPESVLNLDIIREREPFLDTLQLRKFHYELAGTSALQGKELLVISFASLKTVDHLKPVGKIYLDPQSFAISSVEYKAEFEIPVLIRPLLFLYGLDADNLFFEKQLQYHELDGVWYPKDFKASGTGSITKKHWFKSNEHSDFAIEQLFFVNKMQTEKIAPIPEVKRFISKNKFEGQVHNDEGIKWEEMNKVNN